MAGVVTCIWNLHLVGFHYETKCFLFKDITHYTASQLENLCFKEIHIDIDTDTDIHIDIHIHIDLHIGIHIDTDIDTEYQSEQQ